MKSKKPLLSICIPTWNRSKFLAQSLQGINEHLVDVNLEEVEIYISDNCSVDDTPLVVQSFLQRGMPITYNRNLENIGAAGNFLKCMNWSSGKYILLLGDDDFLKPGALKLILDCLRGKDYGVVHIHKFDNLQENIVVYEDVEKFICQVSFWFTFMSGSIYLREIVSQIDSSKYLKSHLLQMPYYIQSALNKSQNAIINQNIIQDGLDAQNNGGYNFYEVFVRNYLKIWYEPVEKGLLSKSCFDYIKKDIYKSFIIPFNYQFLIRRKNIVATNHQYTHSRKGFKIDGAWQILLKHYGMKFYFWISFPSDLIKRFMKKIRG